MQAQPTNCVHLQQNELMKQFINPKIGHNFGKLATTPGQSCNMQPCGNSNA